MNQVEMSKTVSKVVDSTSLAHSIDTIGFDHASIDVVFEPVAAAGTNSAVCTTLKLQQGDTTNSYSDITAFVGGGAGGFTIPTGATAGNAIRFDVDLRGKKRYLNLDVALTTSGGAASVVRLSKAEEGPYNAGTKGVDVAVSG